MKADIVTFKGEKAGTIELSDSVFNREWNADLVKQVILAIAANVRRPWAHAKGRGEVRGGGIKPWKQKGTGRARHGSIRSPLWKGGGVSHGPVKDRNFSQKVNKKMAKAALYSVLSRKLKDGEITFVDAFTLKEPKTKEMAAGLKAVLGVKKQLPSVVIISSTKNKLVTRASRNLPKSKTFDAANISVFDLMKHKNVVIEKAAVAEIK